MSQPITLYSFVAFDRGGRVRWLAHELGLEVTERRLNYASGEHRQPEHRARHPFGQVPVIEMGTQTRWESVAICQSLVEEHPDCGLAVAPGTAERASYLSWLFFAASTFDALAFRVFRYAVMQPDEARCSEAQADVRPLLLQLSEHLEGRDFLLGNQFTLPDLILGHAMQLLYSAKLLDEAPVLMAYRSRLSDRPAAQKSRMFLPRRG